MESIENYTLQYRDTKNIQDLYFDTPDMSLQERKVSMRLRSLGKSHWITLKGPSQPIKGGGVERLEIEKSWSKDALSVVLKELDKQNITMPSLPEDFDNIAPEDLLKGMKLNVVQDRETQRETRNIVHKNKKTGPVLAELGIDHVTFKFGKQNIHLHEIEIEAKRHGGSKAIKKISDNLLKKFKPELQRWDHGKLATGKAIETLLEDGALAEFLDPDNNLKPDAYEKIDDVLRDLSMSPFETKQLI